jgi:hypothetical protein
MASTNSQNPKSANKPHPSTPQGAQGPGYWGPPAQQYPEQQQQRQWYPTQSQAGGQYARGYENDYEESRQASYDPPAYGAQQQQQNYGRQQGSGAAGLLGSAMELVGDQKDGKHGKKSSKGDMVSDFLSR